MADRASGFLTDTVMGAFEQIKKRLQGKGRSVAIEQSHHEATIISVHQGKLELRYTVRVKAGSQGSYPVVETSFVDRLSGNEVKTQPEVLGRAAEMSSVTDVTQQDIVGSFFAHYRPVYEKGYL
ncbi:MAG: hypothetical protein OK456_07170 [Thaumarchaeota archaeon]|nr:hypothetical protein [Nitrososphaerota archaeon]